MIKLGNNDITLKVGSADVSAAYLGSTLVYSGGTPPTPSFNGKWLATYTGGTTSSAECDASSAITSGEITLTDLVAVEIGDCVTSIGNDAFYGCSGLTSITIPNSVTSISGNAFATCSGLTSVTIPNSVTSIGQWAFWNCTSLSSVTIPSGVTSIEQGTFSSCTGLTSITIPSGVISIGVSAFYGCSSLTEVNIPNSVTSIGNRAFANCYSLTSVNIPSGVTSIGEQAFITCRSLTSINIPSGVTSIGNYVFNGCSGLTSITCLATTPPTLGSGVFTSTNNCPIMVPCASVDAYKSAWSAYANRIQGIPPCFNGKWLATYTGGTTSSAQCNASSAITQNEISKTDIVAVEIGNCVTELSLYAFSGYDTLTSVTIPNSVTSIGDSTFWNCTSLTSVTIPNSVTSIDKYAFASCTSLTSVTVLATTPPTLGGNAFYRTTCPIYVPAASVSAYQSTWSAYASRIQAIP